MMWDYHKKRFYSNLLVVGLGLVMLMAVPVAAQAQNPPTVVNGAARAIDAQTLIVGSQTLSLWGVEALRGAGPVLDLRARSALSNAIGKAPVECNLRGAASGRDYAQCTNEDGLDLSLFLLQQGYASASRSQIFNTVFEDPYIKAEIQAQDRGLGLWAQQSSAASGGDGPQGMVLMVLAFVLFVGMLGAFVVLSLIIMRGFEKVIAAQRDTLELTMRERKLREKERAIIASMLDAEMKNNKAKIEAYLVVYEETLKALCDEDRIPKYKKSGDIVQSEPGLDRAVFDRNTDKLDILGARLASQLISFYSDIRTEPDYITIEPEMEREEVLKIVETAVARAQNLNVAAGALIEAFGKTGLRIEER